MLILAVETAMAACSAALVRDGQALVQKSETMTRGHAEAIAPMVQNLFQETGLTPANLDRIAVTTGPGTFAGIRIGLAFARGLGLAQGIPVIGISTTEFIARAIVARYRVGVINAAGMGIYVEGFLDDERCFGPSLMTQAEAVSAIAKYDLIPTFAGSGAAELAAHFPLAKVADAIVPDPLILAQLAQARPPASAPPTPLYLRPPHITQAKAR